MFLGKGKKYKNSYYTLLFISENKVNQKTIKIKKNWLFMFLFSILFFFSYCVYFILGDDIALKKIYLYDKVVEEYQALLKENEQIKDIYLELQHLNDFKKKAIKALSGKSELFFRDANVFVPDTDSSFFSFPNQNDGLRLEALGILYKSIPFSVPVVNPVISRFYEQGHQNKSGHIGIDIVATSGTPVKASGTGIVIFSGWDNDYGYTIVLSHEYGYLTVYKHNRGMLVVEGQRVQQGDVIAYVGNTGRFSTSSHCHFEIWKDGRPINPSIMIKALNYGEISGEKK